MKTKESGQTAIIATIAIMTLMLSVIGIISLLGSNLYSTSAIDINHTQAKALADSGIENALEEIAQVGDTYTGGTFTTPTGTVTITVVRPLHYHYTITVTAVLDSITIKEQAYMVTTPPPAISQFAVFSNNTITGQGATVTGDIQTNNQIYWEAGSIDYGSIYAAARGGGEKDYIDDSQILVNPTTGTGGNFHIWNNVYVQNGANVQNIGEYHNSIKIDGTSTVGTPTKNPNLSVAQINSPVFNYSYAQNLAQTNGTYYANYNAFNTSILSNATYESISGGIDTHTIPAGLYYINDNVQLPQTDSAGNTNIFNFTGSTIISTGILYVYAALTINSTYSNFPALVGTSMVNITVSDLPVVPPVTIQGIVFSDNSVLLVGEESPDSDDTANANDKITITGAVWSDLYTTFTNNVSVTYDSTITSTVNANAFNISPQTATITSWNEIP